MKSVIVLDGHIKSALSAVRALGVEGFTVSVGAERTTAMGMYSRYAQHGFVYPSPYTDRDGFVAALRKEVERLGGKPVVLTFSDATFLTLYAYRESLSDVITMVYPEEMSIEIAFDKAATYSLARVSGVPTITTYTPETFEELHTIAEALTYPAVLKSRRSVTWKDGVGIFGTASFVHSAKELEQKFATQKQTLGEAPLIQVFVEGEEYGVEMLAEKGKMYAQVVHHRIRSLSPTGGASVLKEVMYEGDLKNILITYAEKLVEKLSWTGPIMVEFKVDADTREVYLMEINGRFWGSLPLSIFAGVNMPVLYTRTLLGRAVPYPPLVGREGVMSIHRLGDVAHLVRVLFGRSSMRNKLYPSRMSAIRDFLSVPKGVHHDVWSFHDIKPAVMEIIDILKTKLWK